MSGWWKPFRVSIIRAELLDVQVLDDSTDETQEVARNCVERFAALGMPIVYIHRTNREGFKAGRAGKWIEECARANSSRFSTRTLFPRRIFCGRRFRISRIRRRCRIGMVQTRWTYLNRDYSLLTQVETILLDGHFVMEHGARSRRGTFFQFQRHRRRVAAHGD